jgi:hypothetical protein
MGVRLPGWSQTVSWVGGTVGERVGQAAWIGSKRTVNRRVAAGEVVPAQIVQPRGITTRSRGHVRKKSRPGTAGSHVRIMHRDTARQPFLSLGDSRHSPFSGLIHECAAANSVTTIKGIVKTPGDDFM